MRKLIVLFFCLASLGSVKAQKAGELECLDPYGKTKGEGKFSIGAGFGLTELKVHRKANGFGNAGYLSFDYRLLYGLYVGIRGQFGNFVINELPNSPLDMNSSYNAYGVGLLLNPIKLIKSNYSFMNDPSLVEDLFESIFIGVDYLVLNNKIKDIYRGSSSALDLNAYGPVESFDVYGDPIFKEKIKTKSLPSLSLGVAPSIFAHRPKRSFIKNHLRLVLMAQLNFTDSDELDGYIPVDNALNKLTNKKDGYNLYSLGLRYSF